MFANPLLLQVDRPLAFEAPVAFGSLIAPLPAPAMQQACLPHYLPKATSPRLSGQHLQCAARDVPPSPPAMSWPTHLMHRRKSPESA
jgi:hypothetical protein